VVTLAPERRASGDRSNAPYGLDLGDLPREWDDAQRIAHERPNLQTLEADVTRWCAARAGKKPTE